MMTVYTALDWYWLADDGRVYASARNAIVDKSDEVFLHAQEAGAITRWPPDTSGVQTVAAMQGVMQPYGLSVPGTPRVAAGPTLVKAMTDAQWALVKPRDQACIAGRDSVAENLDMVARAAGKAGVTPKAWFDAALGVPITVTTTSQAPTS